MKLELKSKIEALIRLAARNLMQPRIFKIVEAALRIACAIKWLVEKIVGLILVVIISALALIGVYGFTYTMFIGGIVEHDPAVIPVMIVFTVVGCLCAFFGSIFWCLGFKMLTGIDLPDLLRSELNKTSGD